EVVVRESQTLPFDDQGLEGESFSVGQLDSSRRQTTNAFGIQIDSPHVLKLFGWGSMKPERTVRVKTLLRLLWRGKTQRRPAEAQNSKDQNRLNVKLISPELLIVHSARRETKSEVEWFFGSPTIATRPP